MLDALKKTAIGFAITWAILIPLLLWLDVGVLWWVAIVAFGIIGPISTFVQYAKGNRVKGRFAQMAHGDIYVPTFRYRGVAVNGQSPTRKGASAEDGYSVALLDPREVVLLQAERSLCRREASDFWTDVKGEIARIPAEAITEIAVFTPDQELVAGVRRRVAMEDRITNLVAGLTMGRKVKSAIVEALIFIGVDDGGGEMQFVFEVLSTDRKFDFTRLVDRLSGGELDAAERFSISEDDPAAVWNAKHAAALIAAVAQPAGEAITACSRHPSP